MDSILSTPIVAAILWKYPVILGSDSCTAGDRCPGVMTRDGLQMIVISWENGAETMADCWDLRHTEPPP